MDKKAKRQRTSGNFDERLSPGESLLIWRRRKGWNQGEAARYYKVSLALYKSAEYDMLESFKVKHKVLHLSLTDPEKCLLYRRRDGRTQLEVAKALGIGREWMRLQELGKVPCGKLLRYWQDG